MFDYQSPYPSARLPVFARNVVATSHPLAAQAGLKILGAGGNAVDAAIATAAVMTLVEPCSNGLGSDAFCILWDGQQLHGLNASGRAPAAWTPDYFHRKHGADAKAPPMRGWDSVTVPGAVAGWLALSERFGKLPFGELLAPAIEVAERGYAVPVVVQHKWALAAGVGALVSQPGFAEVFLPRGRPPEVGELFKMPGAARALRAIAETRGAALYGGEIAEALARASAAQGGSMTVADLAGYRPEWVTPISQDYAGHTLHEIPPNGQGITALIALGLLRHVGLASLPVDSAEAQHLQIEAIKLAFADAYRYVADPASMEVSAAQMLDPAYLAERARLIDPKRAQDFGAGNPVKGGTIYLTTADASGMMVSFIQSNYMGFGSGVVEPGFGISLQNRGHGFSLDAASPNVVAPGKRPFHTIIPAFLTRDGQPQMSFGVMGGNMQPQGHLQTLVRMLDHHQNPQAACDAPRWRFNQGLSLNVEAAMPAGTVQGLRERGHQIENINDSYQDFGAGQFIWRLGDPASEGYVAASDPRRDGGGGRVVMRVGDLLPGWRTDFILHRFDAEVLERADCIVVRTPASPTYYWGNCLVLPEAPRDDALAHWLRRFDEEIASRQPASRHVAIGVNAAPAGEALPAWEAAGFERNLMAMLQLEPGDLLAPARPPRGEVVVRPIQFDTEMEQVLAQQAAETDGYEPAGHAMFRRRQMARCAAMARAGIGQWFGAWCDGVLAADCGLMRDGRLGRFQHVETHPAWRRRGLCSALVHAVSTWGFAQWQLQRIHMGADPADVALALYESLGYRRIGAEWSLQRRAPQDHLR